MAREYAFEPLFVFISSVGRKDLMGRRPGAFWSFETTPKGMKIDTYRNVPKFWRGVGPTSGLSNFLSMLVAGQELPVGVWVRIGATFPWLV